MSRRVNPESRNGHAWRGVLLSGWALLAAGRLCSILKWFLFYVLTKTLDPLA